MAHITTLTRAYNDLYNSQANTYSYSGSFETFKESEVKVKLDGTLLTYNSSPSDNTQYSVNLTDKTIHVGGGNLSSGTLSIYPVTDLGAPTLKAPYTAGSAITATDLTNNQKQVMRRQMEFDEGKLDSTGDTMTGHLTMGEDQTIIFEGATDDGYETTLTVADPDADRTVTLPNATDTLVGKATTDTLTNKTVALASNTVSGTLAQFNTAVTDATLVSTTGSETLTNKTLTSPVLNSTISGTSIKDEDDMSSNSATHLATQQSIKAYTDSGSQTLTNKTISADNNTLSGIAASSFVVSNSSGDIDGSASQKAIPSGTVVGTTDSQTLTNKSIDSDTNTITNIVNADIKSSAAIDHSKLAAVSSGNIIVGNGSNVPTSVAMSGDVAIAADGATTIQSDSVEIGMIGCEQTSITNSDLHIPTSGAVVDYVTDALTSAGSFEVIADEDNFPATHPDPKASASVAGIAGMVVSIQNAGGLQINSSGVATNARKAGSGSDDITINGFPSSMRAGVNGNATPYELTDETGLLVTTTAQTDTAYASGAVYEFHRVFVKPADYVQLSDDISDFKSRYRSGTKTANNDSSNDDGDLFFDTGANTMYVYDGAYNSGGSWKEVTSAGDFKFLTVKDHDQASGGSGPTFNGSNEEFDLFDGSSDASINSAAQLIVVLNGVVQKPNSGTFSGSEEGFYLNDTHGIKFCDPPPSGSTLFVTQIGSAVSLNEPADNSVTVEKIATGAVSTAKIADDAITGDKLANNLDLPDNNTIRFGASNDLQIYHDSSTPQNLINSYTSNPLTIMSNGDTSIKSNNGDNMGVFKKDGAVELYHDNTKRFETHSEGTYHYGHSTFIIGDEGESAQLFLHADDGDDNADKWKLVASAGGPFYLQNYTSGSWESNLIAYGNGAVELYHDNSKKFETTSSGVSVTGNVFPSANDSHALGGSSARWQELNISDVIDVSDNGKIRMGDSDDLQIYHDGTDSIISHQGGTSGDLILQTTGSDDDVFIKCNDDFIVNVQGGAENAIIARNNGAVELYHDASKKLETTANGFNTQGSGQVNVIIGSTNAGGAALFLDGDADGDASGNDHAYIYHNTAGALLIRNGCDNAIHFGTNNTERWYVYNTGHFVPAANNTYDIGTSSVGVRNIYTNDLHLSNKGSSNDVDGTWGSYTIQEGADDLFLINKRNGKKYKFNLTEVN